MSNRERLSRPRTIVRLLIAALVLGAVPLTLARSPWQQADAGSGSGGTQSGQTCKNDRDHDIDPCPYHQHLPNNSCAGGTFFIADQGDRGHDQNGVEVVIQANGDFYLADRHGNPVQSGGGAIVIPDRGCVLAIFDPATGTYTIVHSPQLHGGEIYVLIPPPGHGTPTATRTPQLTGTLTPSPTPTFTPSQTATRTASPTVTSTPSRTATQTASPTATRTPRPTYTFTPRPTATFTPRPTATATPRHHEPTATATPRHHEHHHPTATPTPRHHEHHYPTATPTPRHHDH